MIVNHTFSVGEMINIGDHWVISIGPRARAGVLDGACRIGLGFYHRGDPKPAITAICGKGCEILIQSKIGVKVLSIRGDDAIRLEFDVPEGMEIEPMSPRDIQIGKKHRPRMAGAANPHTLIVLIVAIFALIVALAVIAKAQTGSSVPPPAAATPIDESMPATQTVTAPVLGSISAVVAFTIVTVNIIKRLLKDCGPRAALLTAWPTWLYACVVAGLYTALANLAIGTLHGSFFALAWQAVFNAAIASGFFEWYRHAGSPIGNTRPSND